MNLSELVNFCSSCDHQKLFDFQMFLGRIEVNQFVYNDVMLEALFGNNSLIRNNQRKIKRSVITPDLFPSIFSKPSNY